MGNERFIVDASGNTEDVKKLRDKEKNDRSKDWDVAFDVMNSEEDKTWEWNREFARISTESRDPEEIEKYMKDNKELSQSQIQFLLTRLRILRNTK